MFETRALGSAPELFRNFGCGAVLVAGPLIGVQAEDFIGVMMLAEKTVAIFPGIQFAIVAALVFIFYFLGALCVVLGETVFAVFPRRYAERELELDAEVLRAERPALLDAYSGLQRKLSNLHAAVGLGVLGFAIILGSVGFDQVPSHFGSLAFFACIALVAGQRRVWLLYKFRILASIVLRDAPPEQDSGTSEQSREISNQTRPEAVIGDEQ